MATSNIPPCHSVTIRLERSDVERWNNQVHAGVDYTSQVGCAGWQVTQDWFPEDDGVCSYEVRLSLQQNKSRHVFMYIGKSHGNIQQKKAYAYLKSLLWEDRVFKAKFIEKQLEKAKAKEAEKNAEWGSHGSEAGRDGSPPKYLPSAFQNVHGKLTTASEFVASGFFSEKDPEIVGKAKEIVSVDEEGIRKGGPSFIVSLAKDDGVEGKAANVMLAHRKDEQDILYNELKKRSKDYEYVVWGGGEKKLFAQYDMECIDAQSYVRKDDGEMKRQKLVDAFNTKRGGSDFVKDTDSMLSCNGFFGTRKGLKKKGVLKPIGDVAAFYSETDMATVGEADVKAILEIYKSRGGNDGKNGNMKSEDG